MPEQTFIAFLRGINVGGKHKLKMADLRKMFEDAGASRVRSYIQSGNVVFDCDPKRASKIGRTVEKRIAEDAGFEAPIVIRSADELEKIANADPFGHGSGEGRGLYVMLLSDEPEPAAVSRLDPDRSPPDRFIVRGREIFLYCPNGVGRTKLTTGYFDSKLSVTSTTRNWKTLQKMIEMARE